MSRHSPPVWCPLPAFPACRRQITEYLTVRLLTLLAAGSLVVAGCEAPQPAPPIAEVAPAEVEPAQADPQVVARNLSPHYFILFNRGFSVDVVDTPYRSRAKWPTSQVELDSLQNSYRSSNPEMARRLADAWTATPTLVSVTKALGVADPAQAKAVTAWARFVSPQRSSPMETALPPALARDRLLAIGLRQAIQDADRKNYHRAHVLFTDMAQVMGEDAPLQKREGRDIFIRFFKEVPDTRRFDDFAGRLSAYSEARGKEVLLAGEHAAVLHAAGLTSAAAFMRDQLLSQFDLITLPMIDRAIQRGVSYGFPAPERVTRLRARLESLAGSLREQGPAKAESFLAEAVAATPDIAYRDKLADFEKLFAEGGDGSDEGETTEQRLEELVATERPVGDWLREKVAVVPNVPLLTLRPPMSYRFLELISPLGYDPAAKRLFVKSVPERAAGADGIGAAMTGWCRGDKLPVELTDGSGHAILAWYWLEAGRPELARAALIGGGRELLERVKRIPREEVVKLQDAAVDTLLAEVNGYRFLIAAAEIEAAPAGAVRGSGGRYLPELAVLLANWQRVWEDCALPPLTAGRVVAEIEEDVALREAAGRRTIDTRERYSFHDYRFTHGPVPDVVVERAVEGNLFGPSGENPVDTGVLQEFFLKFDWPAEFSQGSEGRWRVKPKKT
jgi:hypothetical protein